MIGLIQRVTQAQVIVNHEIIGKIDQGILALIGIEKKDNEDSAKKLSHKLINYRIFSDKNDQMNLSISDINGGLLLVPQFTLAADTKKGLRPGFSTAAKPEDAKKLFETFCHIVKLQYPKVECGLFGADMKVNLTNDGPVTFWIQV
ncbi:D-aminoacyl-tRNA deacylase [Thiotrichales bacterium 19S9-12]|nr:D-aminoacyl-tRNA deacylase [Thiotrichales bacterium 19S9-11]MCF6811160.1 D-aminoacyl-tRNA deacylase [Thiotrichales bacterium 19S9-12]